MHHKTSKLLKNLSIISFIVLLSGIACAPEKNNAFSNSYHNTTSHYNAYFIANEDIKEIKSIIEEGYDWNYNLILPVFPQFDTVVASSYTEQIEHCIKKASLAIQMHRGSNWEDNAYILIGLARFYSVDYVNAIETFKYVNTKGKGDDEKHEALVALMRTFIEYGELANGIAVSDYLKREKLNKKNLKNLYLNRAYLYQKREDLDNMVRNLIQAEVLITESEERARVNFIIGQVYQSLGFDGESFQYYKRTLKSNPAYELSFYTKLNMAQVTQLAKTNDLKKIRKYFKKLLKDRKNEEFKDKIYFEMANFEIKHGNLGLGIEHYNSSIRSSVNNNRQKGHSYWALGKIYYDSLTDYKTAKLYYDSTLAVLPKDEIEYDAIQNRSEILSNFVEQLTVIHNNDSLLNLSKLSSDSLDVFLTEYLLKKQAEEEEKLKEERRKKRQEEQLAAQQFNDPFGNSSSQDFGSQNFEGGVWYFYNANSISKGQSQFKSSWGSRPLEDDWRRANKPRSLGSSDQEENAENEQENEAQKKDIKKDTPNSEEQLKAEKEQLIATVPYTDEQQQKLLGEIENATYKLGNIYNFDLNESKNAIETFETLLTRFENTEYKPEVLYLLYLICKEESLNDKAQVYKNLLLEEFPNSIYAKLLINPNYIAESQAASEKLKKMYAEAYNLYKEGSYKEALDIVNDGNREFPDNNFSDNMQLLKILIQGKSESIYKYEASLKGFQTAYPESELISYVDSLVNASEQFQINLVNSTKAKFINKLNKTHIFVFAYEKDPELSEALPEYFENILKDHDDLKFSGLILNKDFSMILISEFDSKSKALEFNQKVSSENLNEKIKKSEKFYNFVITKENFEILYKTKELDTYLKFYRKNYPQDEH